MDKLVIRFARCKLYGKGIQVKYSKISHSFGDRVLSIFIQQNETKTWCTLLFSCYPLLLKLKDRITSENLIQYSCSAETKSLSTTEQ
jgi:hypothetical protein